MAKEEKGEGPGRPKGGEPVQRPIEGEAGYARGPPLAVKESDILIALDEYVELRAFKFMYEQHLRDDEESRKASRQAAAENSQAAISIVDSIFNNLLNVLRSYRQELERR